MRIPKRIREEKIEICGIDRRRCVGICRDLWYKTCIFHYFGVLQTSRKIRGKLKKIMKLKQAKKQVKEKFH